MSPGGYGATNGGCRCSFSSGENGCFHDGSADYGGPTSPDETCTHCSRSKPLSSFSSALGYDSVLLMDSKKLRRIVVASAKGFSIGAGLKGGLALFSILARLRRKKSRKVEAFTNEEAISMAIKETLRYGLFLGTFAGTFVSVDEIIDDLGGHNRTAKWRALVAGLVAGPSMLLTGHNTEHKSLAIYILMRAAVLASRCGIKRVSGLGSCVNPLPGNMVTYSLCVSPLCKFCMVLLLSYHFSPTIKLLCNCFLNHGQSLHSSYQLLLFSCRKIQDKGKCGTVTFCGILKYSNLYTNESNQRLRDSIIPFLCLV